MKLTKKQINIIIENTPAAVKGSQKFATVADFGYYRPVAANWGYNAGYIEYNGARVLVVKRFGEIL